VFVLAQRPGPATGLPTWTAQSGLLQATNCSAGEFTRCVIAVSNSQDAFDLMPIAFNLAEQYQISVIVLTDKQIAEALYTQHPYDLERAEIDRGRLVVDPEKLKLLKSSDRFDPHAKGGVSLRWLPGSEAATYCAQGDEHDAVGAVDETSLNTRLQMEKRLRKFEGLKARIPAPHLSIGGRGAKATDWMDAGDEIELLAIGWGSTGDVFEDVMCSDELRGRKIAYLHYTYLWPLRTQELQRLAERSKRIVLVEQNFQGQLSMVIKMECGLDITDKILKYDGRPFFYDELLSSVMERCPGTPEYEESLPGFEYAGISS
jgi:2-oxoglutarate/2-oxoacid ferredoxin oxidoreductase subunit alpha